ncbi:MAG: class I SAM-dependent methyltransferase [Anaerolineales bacterium]|nr:class I SAM-dependent methyltransferase [Anaerolineales bacterium]
MDEIKQNVREFYDQVGWIETEDGLYQNAHYEDLRPVSKDYVHKCHLRINRHLNPEGQYLLDAGSGPIQYPEYQAYSKGYQKRVCLDISITALKEARKRIGDHGMFVVADVSRMPFRKEVFDGVVSLHTIHHLPLEDHIDAYKGIFRLLKSNGKAVIVNGWNQPIIGRVLEVPIRIRKSFRKLRRRIQGELPPQKVTDQKGTFVKKYNAAWLRRELEPSMEIDIFVWRSVSVNVLRTYVKSKLGGKKILEVLYNLEERYPRFFGKHGQYPLIVFKK